MKKIILFCLLALMMGCAKETQPLTSSTSQPVTFKNPVFYKPIILVKGGVSTVKLTPTSQTILSTGDVFKCELFENEISVVGLKCYNPPKYQFGDEYYYFVRYVITKSDYSSSSSRVSPSCSIVRFAYDTDNNPFEDAKSKPYAWSPGDIRVDSFDECGPGLDANDF